MISDHWSAALLRSRHKLGTALWTFLTLVALHPSFLSTLVTIEEATPYFMQSFLAVMPTLLLAAFAIRFLAACGSLEAGDPLPATPSLLQVTASP